MLQDFSTTSSPWECEKRQRNRTAKLDHNTTDAHRLSMMFTCGLNTDNGPFSVLAGPITDARSGVRGPRADNGRVNYDWIINPTLLFHMGAGISRQDQLLVNTETEGAGWNKKLGIQGTSNGAFPEVILDPWNSYGRNQRGLPRSRRPTSTTPAFPGPRESTASGSVEKYENDRTTSACCHTRATSSLIATKSRFREFRVPAMSSPAVGAAFLFGLAIVGEDLGGRAGIRDVRRGLGLGQFNLDFRPRLCCDAWQRDGR